MATRDTADAHYSRLSLLVPKTQGLDNTDVVPSGLTSAFAAMNPRPHDKGLGGYETEENEKIKMGRKNFGRCHGVGGGRGEARGHDSAARQTFPTILTLFEV